MAIDALKNAIRLGIAAGVTPWIWGRHGVGKSSIIRQIAVELGWGFVDFRCSQIESVDLRGLPQQTEEARTRFLPPAELPRADLSTEEIRAALDECNRADLQQQHLYDQRWMELQPRFPRGILFLDELNRADSAVLNAVFQLVLDRAIGQYVLPPGWVVVVAGNHGDDYEVNEFSDKALLDRFCHLSFPDGVESLNDWQDYMNIKHGAAAAAILEFTTQNINHLELGSGAGLGIQVEPSRRSWEAVVRVWQAFETGDFTKQAKRLVTAGLIGRDLAIAVERFQKPAVKPADLIEQGVQRLEAKLNQLTRCQLTNLMCALAKYAGKKMSNEHVADTVLDFLDWLMHRSGHDDHDLVVGFCRSIDPDFQCNDATSLTVMRANPRLARRIRHMNGRTKHSTLHERLLSRPALYDAVSKLIFADG